MTTDPRTEATNFDHWSGELAVDPYPTLGRLRDACPVARSEQSDGFWLFTRFDDVGAALKDHDTFSSTTISIPRRTNDFLPVPPLDQDPPAHTRYRQMLLPFFTPQRTALLEPVARETARSCAADVAAKGGCEGMALWHLDAQRELRSRPELLGTAVEEFLRAYSPVSIARIVTTEVTVGECPIARDDMVLLSLPSANRDDRKYEDADKIVLDRAINPHVAFGLGVHRCLGAHIARMELRVGLEEFFAAVPEFRLVDPDAVTWKPGPIRGPREFVLEF